jgi:hypothetical protein
MTMPNLDGAFRCCMARILTAKPCSRKLHRNCRTVGHARAANAHELLGFPQELRAGANFTRDWAIEPLARGLLKCLRSHQESGVR